MQKRTIYNSQILSPTNVLEDIILSVSNFDTDTFEYAISFNNFSEHDIELMACEVSDYTGKLKKEFIKLKQFGEVFNKKFATDDNKCFDTCLRLFRKLRQGIGKTKQIFLAFCPLRHRKSREYLMHGIKRPSIFYSSYFHPSIPTCRSLFELEVYKPSVRHLYEEMTEFFDILLESMHLCKEILNEEKFIKCHPHIANGIYNQSEQEFLKKSSNVIRMFTSEMFESIANKNSLWIDRQKYLNQEAFAAKAIHTSDIGTFEEYVQLCEFQRTQNSGMSTFERNVWGNNADARNEAIYLIQHFDEVLPENKRNSQTLTKHIVMFMYWCGNGFSEKQFCEYFTEHYSKGNGSLRVSKYSAINSAKSKMVVSEDFKSEYESFLKRLEYVRYLYSTTKNKSFSANNSLSAV